MSTKAAHATNDTRARLSLSWARLYASTSSLPYPCTQSHAEDHSLTSRSHKTSNTENLAHGWAAHTLTRTQRTANRHEMIVKAILAPNGNTRPRPPVRIVKKSNTMTRTVTVTGASTIRALSKIKSGVVHDHSRYRIGSMMSPLSGTSRGPASLAALKAYLQAKANESHP